ncbi:MAG: carbohydrate deacetylase [Ardenticatenaceae bacterium]|nr:carbohydrate deacetylase [Ardenticatenaceae bacterium]
MNLRLIINSDDYGRSSEVSRGIREAHLRGVVSSTTCMMNFPNVVDDLALALAETPELGLGVHLVLTAGRPLLPADQVPTLVNPTGGFFKLDQLVARLDTLDPSEVKAEWRAQIEKFIQAAGRKPTHLDSHHHSSYFTADLFQNMLDLALEYDCAIRQIFCQENGDSLNGLPWAVQASVRQFAPALMGEYAPPTTDGFYTTFYDDWATKEELLRIIGSLPETGTYEIMCHPGYSDAALLASTVYASQRDRELAILTDPDIRQAIAARQIELVTFAEVADSK